MSFATDYFMALAKATRLFLVACVHYNYKWITNSVVDYQISSSVSKAFTRVVQHTFVKTLIKIVANITTTNKKHFFSFQGNVEVVINKELMAINKENKHVVVQDTTQTILLFDVTSYLWVITNHLGWNSIWSLLFSSILVYQSIHIFVLQKSIVKSGCTFIEK